MKEPELLIFLDSNILFREHPMKSPKILHVFYTMTLTKAWLQIPQLILDEYVNNYREQILKSQG
jgi:hypothetical protein